MQNQFDSQNFRERKKYFGARETPCSVTVVSTQRHHFFLLYEVMMNQGTIPRNAGFLKLPCSNWFSKKSIFSFFAKSLAYLIILKNHQISVQKKK